MSSYRKFEVGFHSFMLIFAIGLITSALISEGGPMREPLYIVLGVGFVLTSMIKLWKPKIDRDGK
ncbi:hypothetical protein N780_09930 [Pontibacillus chungwhensis BH030062]|uniref:Uncharacterized protein n=1 Tax=Pontibacillus chungwhensis BH030062 TaxID=1385513 RepID=A0A0A2V7W8_9BACI|nr:hypothetical protein [Pontibacillus chungwhensis]KGP89800.1 hypothetical protein N780_09930 [Pontibacillus chungwhensis BH030062]